MKHSISELREIKRKRRSVNKCRKRYFFYSFEELWDYQNFIRTNKQNEDCN